MDKKEKSLNRVYKIEINKNDEVYKVCDKFAKMSKDLYNTTNFIIRQIYLISKKINNKEDVEKEVLLKYNEILKDIEYFNQNTTTNKIEFKVVWGGTYIGGRNIKSPLIAFMKDKEQFKALPSTTSQEIVGQVIGAWIGYFESLSSYCKHKSKFKGVPKPPKYKNTTGCSVFVISSRSITIKDGIVSFKKARKGLKSYDEFNCCNIKIPLPDWDRYKAKDGNLTYIRVVPKNDVFIMEVLYKIKPKPQKEIKGRTIAIDIGVDRLATVANNIGIKPFSINGNPLKSLNKNWNKQVAQYKSILMKTNEKHSSKRYLQMCNKRNNQMDTYMHQSASYIINWCMKYDIDTIIIGKNDFWKQNANIGKETQTFVQIPHAKFIDKITYRAEGLGIRIILQEESYTSKASFIDSDYIPTYGVDDASKNFSGKRVDKNKNKTRGMYTSKEGVEIHADLNGAYNILRKHDSTFIYNDNYLHPYIVIPNQKVA